MVPKSKIVLWKPKNSLRSIHDAVVFPAAFEKGRLNIDKKGTPSTLGKYI
jgi:hypothetical protein